MASRDTTPRTGNTLAESVAKLQEHYGAPGLPPVTDPFEIIVWENAAYLVDDTRRRAVFELLRHKVGTEPRAIAAMPLEELAAVIEKGGMRPEMRAGKLRNAAAVALDIGPARLRQAVQSSPAERRSPDSCATTSPGAWAPTCSCAVTARSCAGGRRHAARSVR